MHNRLLAFARLALAVAERVPPEHAHKFAPKIYTQPQLFACLLLKEYLHLDYRSIEEVLEASDRLRRILRLRRVPDYSTLWRFAAEKVTPEVIEKALAETVALLPFAGGKSAVWPWIPPVFGPRTRRGISRHVVATLHASNGAGQSGPPRSGPARRWSSPSACAAVPAATSRI